MDSPDQPNSNKQLYNSPEVVVEIGLPTVLETDDFVVINSKPEFNNQFSRSPRSTPQVAKKEEKTSSEKDENEDSDSRPNNLNNSMEEFS